MEHDKIQVRSADFYQNCAVLVVGGRKQEEEGLEPNSIRNVTAPSPHHDWYLYYSPHREYSWPFKVACCSSQDGLQKCHLSSGRC